jgi:hypothetical protein
MKWLKRLACVFGYHDLYEVSSYRDIRILECRRCGAWPYHSK